MRYVDLKRATERYLAQPRPVENQGAILMSGSEGVYGDHYSQRPHVLNGIPISRKTMKLLHAPIGQLMEEQQRAREWEQRRASC